MTWGFEYRDDKKQETYVHNATIDITEFLEAEKPRPMGRVIESKGLFSGTK